MTKKEMERNEEGVIKGKNEGKKRLSREDESKEEEEQGLGESIIVNGNHRAGGGKIEL